MALRNLKRYWRHSLATILAISASFTAISLFDGFIQELYFQIEDGYSRRGMLGDVIIQRQGADKGWQEDFWSFTLTAEDQRALEAFFTQSHLLPSPATEDSSAAGHQGMQIKDLVRFLHVSGMVGNSTSQAMFIGQGYDLKAGAVARGERWAWNTVAGTPLHLVAVPGIVLGQGLGSFVGCLANSHENIFRPTGGIVPEVREFQCAEDKLVLTSSTMNAQINTHRLPVQGLFDGGLRDVDRRAVHMSLADAQSLLDTDHISMLSVSLSRKDQIEPFLRVFSQTFAQGGRLEAVPWRQHSFGTLSRGAEQILNMFRNVFMVIVAAISLMSVANTMMRVIHERATEIGSLRSFGFRRLDIQTLFAFEGMFLALSACLGGLLVTILLTWAVNALGIPYKGGILSAPIYLVLHQVPWSWLLNLTVLAMIATLTSWLASAKIAKAQVAVLLSQETH